MGQVGREKNSVPTENGTRKSLSHFFAYLVPTEKTLCHKAFLTLMGQWDKWNNGFKKYLGSWKDRLYSQEYSVLEKMLFHLSHCPKARKVIHRGKDGMQRNTL